MQLVVKYYHRQFQGHPANIRHFLEYTKEADANESQVYISNNEIILTCLLLGLKPLDNGSFKLALDYSLEYDINSIKEILKENILDRHLHVR